MAIAVEPQRKLSNGHVPSAWGRKSGLGTHVLTTGQVAHLCAVAPRTVSKWFDSGRLRGYRIPGSHDRRIPRAELVAFLREHGMFDALRRVGEGRRVLVVSNAGLAAQLGPLVAGVIASADLFLAGAAVQQHAPAAVVLDGTMGRSAVVMACASLGALEPSPAVVVLAPEDWPRSTWMALGATHVLQQPVDVGRLAALLTEEG